MRQATLVWSTWQRLLKPFASAFTRPSYRRFVEWVTALVLNVEEHTITQSVTAIDRLGDWKAMESFAEYAAWKPNALTRTLNRLVDEAPGRTWHGYRISAVDDTKVHRSGENVWGACTFHEYTARCPNRATTVRAHNWVCLGTLLCNGGKPAWYLPVSGRLYFRKSQLPARSGASGPKEVFRTKCELAVELLREQARIGGGAPMGVFDGGYALRNVVRPLVVPEDGQPRIDFLTRLRHDARLHALPPAKRPKGKRGRNPKWGRKLAPPRQGGRWPGSWQKGEAFIYGRVRKVRWKEVVCLWRVIGHDVSVKAAVHRSDLGGGPERIADGRVVRRPVPPRGWIPGLEAAVGMGRVPSLDEEADRADEPGAMVDDEPDAAAAIPAGCGGMHRLVVAAALEQEERSTECIGRGATTETSSAGNSAFPVELAGR
jgi:hypothetical protein